MNLFWGNNLNSFARKAFWLRYKSPKLPPPFSKIVSFEFILDFKYSSDLIRLSNICNRSKTVIFSSLRISSSPNLRYNLKRFECFELIEFKFIKESNTKWTNRRGCYDKDSPRDVLADFLELKGQEWIGFDLKLVVLIFKLNFPI